MTAARSSGEPQVLVGDVGGSTARFALARRGKTGIELSDMAIRRCADHVGMAEAIGDFLAETGRPRPHAGAIAIAGPIIGDRAQLTNHPWSFSIAETRRRVGLERLEIINDFTAVALALPLLGPDERQQVGGGAAEPEQPIGAIGPGTGLGVSGLVRADRRWVALKSEGGHASFAPMTERESRIADLLRQRLGHVSWERVLSGPGLVNLHRVIAELAGEPIEELPPEAVTARGLSASCRLCRETLEIFCAALGTAAGNLALTLGARGGVYIAGGIVPQLGTFFAESGFRARFESKGRLSEYVQAIPTFVVTAANPGLIGAAAALDIAAPADAA
jgi:glucokinase